VQCPNQEESVPRRDRPTPAEERERELEQEAEEERRRPLTRELVEFETAPEGEAGEGREASGTLPESVGGTTGTGGHVAGEQAPGSTAPPVTGIDPEEARRHVGKHRRSQE
jgi:hypothetical protein